MNEAQATTRIVNEDGFHARPAGIFAKAAAKYQSTVEIRAKGQCKNAKSIMSVMTLGLRKGDEIVLSARGPDAESALHELKSLIERGIPSA
jgi:phosphocarrier protein HPr